MVPNQMNSLAPNKPNFYATTISLIKKPVNFAATKIRNIGRRFFNNRKSLHSANHNLKKSTFESIHSLFRNSTYSVSGSFYVETLNQNQQCVVSIYFQNHNGEKLGFQKTISCNEHWNDFFVFFSTPQKRVTTRIVIEQQDPFKSEIYLIANTYLESVRGNNPHLAQTLNTFVNHFFQNQNITHSQMKIFFDQCQETFGKEAGYFFRIILKQMRPKMPYAAKHLGYQMLQDNLTDPDFAKHLYFLYNRSGSITEKFAVIRELVDKKYLPDDFLLKKSEEEQKLLTHGLELNLTHHTPTYKAEKSVLYLLHNSLPYNSGGYATRSHGLIKGISNHNLFTIRGLARSGYPKDRSKHISKKLEFPLPESTSFEDIEYHIMSQEIDKDFTLVKPYVDFFTDEIVEQAKKYKPSIIHAASFYHNGMAAIQAAKKLGIKSVYEIRGLQEITKISKEHFWEQTEQYKFYARLEAQALQNADASFTITKALKQLMISRGVTKEIHVVPNAVNIDKFKPLQKNFKFLKEMNIQPEEVVIGYVGSVVEYEGLDDLLVACKNLQAKNIRFKLLIVGDGVFLPALKKLTKTYGLSKEVIFTGRVPHGEVQKYMSIIDIMPFPRKPYLVCEMVSPLKPFESLATQKAVIVSSCAALEEIIQHEKTGLVFKKANTDDLTEKLITLIQNPSLRNTLAENGYKWVCENRSWKSVSKIVTDVYEDLYKQIQSEQR